MPVIECYSLYIVLQDITDIGLDLVQEVHMREGEAAIIGEGHDQDLDQDHAPQNIEEGDLYVLIINF